MSRTARTATADPAAIRARLGALVDADGRPQRAIAEAAGMAPPNLSRILNDRINPTIGSVGRLLRALNLPWSSLDG